ncbi:C6 zinc finger protein [Sarocladium implicatum]|nr:C6 zinc finger protein [Sarocladium implicatum]
MGFECEFLMRTILGLSALHLARFRHDKKDYYINVGLNHYQVASRLATRRMDHLELLTREDCEHLHLFAVLTLFFALGSPKQDQHSLILGDAIVPSWLTMLRSAEPILKVLNPSTYKGALSPLFSYGRERWRVLYGDTRWKDNSLMVDLQAAVNRSCSDPGLLSIYNGVIDHLRNVLGRLMPQVSNKPTQTQEGSLSGPSSPGSISGQTSLPVTPLEAWDIFVWQWDAAKDFIPLLRGDAPHQEAMTIYAHFLIMLKKLDTQWWLEGWAIHIMERVWASLDDEYKLWIQWPIQEIGWVPP